VDEREPSGFALISSTDVALAPDFRSAATTLKRLQASPVEGVQRGPDLIPEGEQALRRSRTVDEREPSGFPLISSTDVALAADFTSAATMLKRLPASRVEGV